MKLRHLTTLLTALTTVMSIAAAAVLATAPSATQAQGHAGLPQRLSETGLPAEGAQPPPFTPQYALWSDGADKRRWIALPAGTSIDASNPDAWVFPVGTRLWKEFSHQGRKVETRYIERTADGQWRFAAYVWRADGSDADLAPARGAVLDVAQAPGGRYEVPSRGDCLACHEGAPVPVLGFSALQLSRHLPEWVARGWLRGLPSALLDTPPQIAAASDTERAALGYLHANCGHCHNRDGAPVPVRLTLAQRVADPSTSAAQVLASAVGAASRYRPGGAAGLANAAQVITPGQPDASVLALRMRSRHAQMQMPPLGTQLPDREGIALVERWIASDLATRLSAVSSPHHP